MTAQHAVRTHHERRRPSLKVVPPPPAAVSRLRIVLPEPVTRWILLGVVCVLIILTAGGLYLWSAPKAEGFPGIVQVVRAADRPRVPTCSSFVTQKDAQLAFEADRTTLRGLDGDNDGKACESLPQGVR